MRGREESDAEGAAINIFDVAVDWANIDGLIEEDALSATINLDINDISLFVRIRF